MWILSPEANRTVFVFPTRVTAAGAFEICISGTKNQIYSSPTFWGKVARLQKADDGSDGVASSAQTSFMFS